MQALNSTTLTVNRVESDACIGLHHRTTWNIVWSCLLTISLCTWVAGHPNVPGPKDGKITTSLFRAWNAMDALLTPELVITWAMQQWFVARRSVRDVDVPGKWTTTHGYFISMGGLVPPGSTDRLDRLGHPLTPDEFIFLIREGYIDIPNVTEDDIKDKSKGDMVSKGFTVLQTGRFVMQYIARRAQRLPVTELELATLAFAVTNTATYIFWWNKPLNVQSPVQVALKKPVSDGDWERCTRFMGSAEMVDYESPWPRTKIEEEVGFEKEPPSKGVSDLEIADHRSTSREGVHPTEDETRTWPIYMFESARTDQALEWQQRTTQQRVHRWYSGHLSPRQLLVSFLVAGASAETFGAIHCMAWYFSFPSEAEQTLWRICCIVIMGLPVLLAMIYATLTLFYKSLRPYRPVVRYAVMTTRYVYVLARAAILVQVFISLRSVPPGVFDSIDWITFIPHA